jgi:hypothetical protein
MRSFWTAEVAAIIIDGMKIPFYPNTGDGTHCFQAALRMVLGYFEPEREFTYEELDRISQKLPGKWTWPTAAMLWLMEHRYELRLVEEFDYAAFAERGADYLMEKCGQEVAQVQIENSDIGREQEIAAKFVQYAPLEHRIPELADVERFIADNWVVICNVNSSLLHNQSGYSGHFVIVVDVTADEVVIHDPGLPPYEGFAVMRAGL